MCVCVCRLKKTDGLVVAAAGWYKTPSAPIVYLHKVNSRISSANLKRGRFNMKSTYAERERDK